MRQPRDVEEEDVILWLTGDGQFLVTGDRAGQLNSWNRENIWDRYQRLLTININDIYRFDMPQVAHPAIFDKRELIRIFYQEDGKNRYAIFGWPDNNRDDDFRIIFFASELMARTGRQAGSGEPEDLERSLGGLQPR